jgi:hypothetical protein
MHWGGSLARPPMALQIDGSGAMIMVLSVPPSD